MALPKPKSHQALMLALLTRDPANPAIQRMVHASANISNSTTERTNMLKRLVDLVDLDPGVRDLLATDRVATVRAAAWARPGWDPDRVVAMLTVEKSAAVRLAALAHPGLPVAAVEEVVYPMTKTAADAVLRYAPHLPGPIVHDALKVLAPEAGNRVTDQRAATFLAAATAAQVAPLLLADPDAEPRLRFAALTAPSLAPGQVTDALTRLAAELPAETIQTVRFGDELGVGKSLTTLVTSRHDLPVETLELAQETHLNGTGPSGALFRAAIDRACLADDEVGLHLLRRNRSNQHMREVWAELTEPQRTTGVAEAIARSAECSQDTFELVSSHLSGTDEATLTALFLDVPQWRGPLPTWALAHPDLVVTTMRRVDLPNWPITTSRLSGKSRDASRRALVAAYLADPDAYPEGAGGYLASSYGLTVEELVQFPLSDLVVAASADQPRAAVLEALGTTLVGVDDPDVAAAQAKARVVESLMGEKFPLPGVVDVVNAATA